MNKNVALVAPAQPDGGGRRKNHVLVVLDQSRLPSKLRVDHDTSQKAAALLLTREEYKAAADRFLRHGERLLPVVLEMIND